MATATALVKSAPTQLVSLSPLLLKVLSPLSAPLNKYPKVVRDTLGWVSLITLFWAGTIWAYLLFFHKPVEADIPHSAPHIAGDTAKSEHGGSDHGKSGHEAKGETSGKHDSNAAGHGEPAKKAHAAADEHAEATHPEEPHKAPDEHGGH